ncbi:MAG: Gfo/Idh/MocA family oxidoreductase [Spirochaetes bacterium]|nr:Gfo/Idh/MocA family oxidoreductase [Spirochaetota bacterium]
MARKLRMGMVGGSYDAFIGDVHRKAARMDGRIDVVAGAFSSNPEKSQETGKRLAIDPSRVYDTFDAMLAAEKKLPADKRIDFVTVVTPNHMHFKPVKAALEAGFHVVCEKPLSYTMDEGREIKNIIAKTKRAFMLTHNYTGYPMVKQAKAMVSGGELGKVMKVVVEFPQGWILALMSSVGLKINPWRMDPKVSGISNCMGDIGTHCFNLAEYITGLTIDSVCADLTCFKGQPLDNDGNVLLRFNNGAKGVLHASQISFGEACGLNIRVYCEKGRIAWKQENPNYLLVQKDDTPVMTYERKGGGYLTPAADRGSRIPVGHPEAFIEAFANLYVNFADTLVALEEGRKPSDLELDFPGVDDGLRGLAFIKAVVDNGFNDNSKWTKITV